jgi:hypothetical protein
MSINSIIKICGNYPIENLAYDQKDSDSFVKRHVLARGRFLALAPSFFITSAISTIVGMGMGLGTILTLGKYPKTFKAATTYLNYSHQLLMRPYICFLKAINPKANFPKDCLNNKTRVNTNSLIDSYMIKPVIMPLHNKAEEYAKSNNSLQRHVASRLTYALLAISCLVVGAVSGVIGIPAAALSILTLGTSKSINIFTYDNFKVTSIIYDLFYLTIKFINPWASTNYMMNLIPISYKK